MAELHLWRLPIRASALAAIAQVQRIPLDDADHGYAIHALLRAVFGTASPKPWHYDSKRGLLWAYAAQTVDTASLRASPAAAPYAQAIDWRQAAAKPVPVLSAGKQVAFDLRACPVVRHGGRGDKNEKPGEHDFLLWQARQLGKEAKDLDPAQTYGDWLSARAWPRDAGASLVECGGRPMVQVMGWHKPMERHANAWRGRGDGRLRLPDVSFQGQLVVTDGAAFARLLARGIGRHRAFGYGMLLLRPAGV